MVLKCCLDVICRLLTDDHVVILMRGCFKHLTPEGSEILAVLVRHRPSSWRTFAKFAVVGLQQAGAYHACQSLDIQEAWSACRRQQQAMPQYSLAEAAAGIQMWQSMPAKQNLQMYASWTNSNV